ncbi:MAG TPA: VWA domain-containing protein, partial [bacterium]|nr:VWA domain-containing protein [bacterium]
KDTDGDNGDDLAEIVYGSDPKDPDNKIPDGLFYVVLPYSAPDRAERKLTFSTKINSVDVGILLDRSGSMTNELENLKTGIQDSLINGILEKMDGVDLALGLISFGTWDDRPYTVEQKMTKDYDAVNTAVGATFIQGSGPDEPHSESIYQASTGEGLFARANTGSPIGGWETYTIEKGDCTGATGSVGGICLREMTFPIFIMITDVAFIEYPVGKAPFGEYYWDINARGHSREEAMLAMNGINAKFIGIDSGFSCTEYDTSYNCIGTETPSELPKDDYTILAEGTSSLDKDGKPFLYHTASSNGSGLSDQIADAVVELTTYVQMDVTTKTTSEQDCDGINASEFVDESVPVEANPPEGVASQDDTTFYKVEPGTDVTFMVYFKNDFCVNNTENPKVYEAMIRVLGGGAYVSSKKIQVIVPAGDKT